MPKAQPSFRETTAPVIDDGAGYRRVAMCPLCGDLMDYGTLIWWQMPTDPPSLRRVVHARCAHEYATFRRAMRPLFDEVTPAH